MDCLIAGVGAEVGLVVVDEEVLVESVVRVVSVERVEVSVAGTEEDAATRIEVLLEEDSKLELLEAATLKTETELPPVPDLI